MNGVPKSVYNPLLVRNTGWPTGGDPYGHGASIVVRERESRLHPNSLPLEKEVTGKGMQVNQISYIERQSK